MVDVGRLRAKNESMVSVGCDLPVAWLQHALRETDAEIREGGRVQLDLLLQPNGLILARGPLKVSIHVPCARCLEPSAVDGSAEICVTYVVGAAEAAEAARAAGRRRKGEEDDEGLELDGEDLERYVYDGETLDLAPMVAERAAMAYPMRILCSRGEACRGLCSGCGANLNELPPDAAVCANCARPLDGSFPGADGLEEGSAEGGGGSWQEALRKLRDN